MFVKKISLFVIFVSFVDIYGVHVKETSAIKFLGRPLFKPKMESFVKYVDRCNQDIFIHRGRFSSRVNCCRSSSSQNPIQRTISPVSVILSVSEEKFFERQEITAGDNLSKLRKLQSDLNRLQRQAFIEDGHDEKVLKTKCAILEKEYRLFLLKVKDPEESSFLSNLRGLKKELGCE